MEQYDARLDRINNLLEKYALLNTLYGRLAQQAPARAQMSNRPRYTQPMPPQGQPMPQGKACQSVERFAFPLTRSTSASLLHSLHHSTSHPSAGMPPAMYGQPPIKHIHQ